jgi:excisionase family DNA binding protein
MEATRGQEQSSMSVVCDEGSQPWAPARAVSLERITKALDAATSSLNAMREALQGLPEMTQGHRDARLYDQPVLLTVPQVCGLLGYHKTKVYGLMNRGLIPYLLDRRTGRRRVEYRAVQQFVKRLRDRRLERSAS